MIKDHQLARRDTDRFVIVRPMSTMLNVDPRSIITAEIDPPNVVIIIIIIAYLTMTIAEDIRADIAILVN